MALDIGRGRFGGGSGASHTRTKSDISPVLVHGASGSGQHGGNSGHLPARRENFDFVSKLKLTGKFGDVTPESIADVAVHKGFAYLNSWNEPTCTRGGTYIVDIRDPAAPKEIGFVAAPARSIHGEGAHVVTYKGRDILAVNNEPCTFADPGTAGPGGFDLIDVTDPATPVKLGAPGAPTGGDTGPDDGSLAGHEVPHSNHSAVMWEFGGTLYLVTIDNLELHDVDILDISDPATPKPVPSTTCSRSSRRSRTPGNIGSFAGTFHHDTVDEDHRRQVDREHVYWDGGYVTYDLSDPLAPKYIGDTSFEGPDPLTGAPVLRRATPTTRTSRTTTSSSSRPMRTSRPIAAGRSTVEGDASTRRPASAAAPRPRACPTA